MPSLLHKFNITISTDNPNFLGGPDNSPTAGANILPGTLFGTGTLQAWNLWPDKAETVFPKPLYKGFTIRGKFGYVPTVLCTLFHSQSAGIFRHALELFVVVQAGTGSVLNPILKVFQVYHFMDQGGTGFFKGPVQVFSTKVDFIIAALFGAILPSLPPGTPPIGPTGMIRGNGDHRLFQLPGKEPGVES